jgi:signal transduction histidine kinase
VTDGRRIRFGVEFRLFAGLIGIAGLTIVTIVAMLLALERFRLGFDHLANVNLPGLNAAAEIARQTEALAAKVPGLATASSQSARRSVADELEDQIARIDESMQLLEQSGIAPDSFELVREQRAGLVRSLRGIDALVERRSQLDAKIAELSKRLYELASAVRASSDEARRIVSGAMPPQGETLPPIEALQIWMSTAFESAATMLTAVAESNPARVNKLATKAAGLSDERAGALAALPDIIRRPLVTTESELRTLTDDPDGIFAQRLAQLSAAATVNGSMSVTKALATKFVTSVAGLQYDVRQEIEQQSALYASLIAGSATLFWIVGIVSALAAASICFYVHGSIIRRMKALRSAMQAGVDGKPVDLKIAGRDEIAAMADSVQFFIAKIGMREDELRASEHRLRAILQQSPVAVIISRPDGAVAFANDRAIALAAELNCRSLVELLPGAAEGPGNAVAGISGGDLGHRLKIGKVDGIERAVGSAQQRSWLLETIQATEFQGLPSTIVWAIDITRRKQAEEAMRIAKEQAETASRTKSEFLANMSHELRTPLNAVLGFAQVMRDAIVGPLSPQYQEYARYIVESGTHLLNVINDILDLSKVEAGRLELNERRVSVPHIIQSCVDLVQGRAALGAVILCSEIAPDLPRLSADPVRLQQILLNLLSNAIKFTRPGGRVTVSVARAPDGSVSFMVADTGIGMTRSEIAVALEVFGQVDSAVARRQQGTGLGLPLARLLTELHGGNLRVESEKSVGTVVTVVLPASRIREAA